MALNHVKGGHKVRLEPVASPLTRTVALVKTDRFEAVQLVLRAGTRVQPHSVDGFATIYCIEGAVSLDGPRKLALATGDWMYLDRGEEHGLTASEDTSLLLTVLFDG